MTIRIAAILLLFAAISPLAAADEPPATAPATRPAEIRRGVTMGGPPEERGRRFYEKIVRELEPSLVGDPSRLGLYLDLFKREFVEDTRTFAFDVTATSTVGGTIAATGRVEFDEHRRSLAEFLKTLGFAADVTGIQLLPAASLGDERFGVVRAQRCFVYDRPAAPRETLTEAVEGDGIFLLAPADDGHFLCHAADGYVGYIAADAIDRVTAEQFDQHVGSAAAPDRDERVEGAIAAAQTLLGTKYVWGGMTGSGIDCSGLVYAAFRAQGVRLPRDADQQALAGKLAAMRWHRSSLRRGDVLFFLGRRGTIHHTGIYLGNNQFIEATDPLVTVSSFDPSAPNYSKRRDDSFCFAKRVFD